MTFSKKQWMSLFAPIGAATVLTFSSHATMDMMLAMLAATPSEPASFPQYQLLGGIGWVLFGHGVFNASLCRRDQARQGLLIAVAVTFFLGAVAIAFGSVQLYRAFRNLAIAETVEPAVFNANVASANMPFLVGWCAVVLAALIMFLITFVDAVPDTVPANRQPAKKSSMLALLSSAVFMLACVLGFFATQNVESQFENPIVEPSMIASGVTRLIGSEFLTAIGVAGCGIVALLMANESECETDSDVETEGSGATDS